MMQKDGMSVRGTRGHLEQFYGSDASPGLISAVIKAVLEEVAEWQKRPQGNAISKFGNIGRALCGSDRELVRSPRTAVKRRRGVGPHTAMATSREWIGVLALLYAAPAGLGRRSSQGGPSRSPDSAPLVDVLHRTELDSEAQIRPLSCGPSCRAGRVRTPSGATNSHKKFADT